MASPAIIQFLQGDTPPATPGAGKISLYAKTNGLFYSLNSSGVEVAVGGAGGAVGTVTSVALSGGTTGLTTTGGPVTSSGTITLAGTLSLSNGGTGAVTRQLAINSLTGAVTSGAYLRGDGTNVSMSAIQAADVPTLNQSTTGSAATLTTSRTISITGDATWSVTFNGSANTSAALTLANSGVTAGTYGSATQVPVIIVDAKGRVTSVTNTTITGGSGGSSTYAGLTDAATVNLPVVNAPLQTALATKVDAITASPTVGAGVTTINRTTVATPGAVAPTGYYNRPLFTDHSLTVDLTGAVAGDAIMVWNSSNTAVTVTAGARVVTVLPKAWGELTYSGSAFNDNTYNDGRLDEARNTGTASFVIADGNRYTVLAGSGTITVDLPVNPWVGQLVTIATETAYIGITVAGSTRTVFGATLGNTVGSYGTWRFTSRNTWQRVG